MIWVRIVIKISCRCCALSEYRKLLIFIYVGVRRNYGDNNTHDSMRMLNTNLTKPTLSVMSLHAFQKPRKGGRK
jgi:hypothetical protein